MEGRFFARATGLQSDSNKLISARAVEEWPDRRVFKIATFSTSC